MILLFFITGSYLFLIGLISYGYFRESLSFLVIGSNFKALIFFIFLIHISGIYYHLIKQIKLFLKLWELALLFIIIIFFSFLGPYFNPPADTVYHVNLLQDSLKSDTFSLGHDPKIINRSLFSFLRIIFDLLNFESSLWMIFSFHSLNLAILFFSCYISSRLFGLNGKWSFFSMGLMILFFGTNRFSYLTYYTLAPTQINISVYWLFTATLYRITTSTPSFNYAKIRDIIYVLYPFVFIFPILFFNHKQEIGFIFFSITFFSVIILLRIVYNYEYKLYSIATLFFLFFILFLFPLIASNNFNLKIFNLDKIKTWGEYVIIIKNSYIVSKLSFPRFIDSMGLMSFLSFLFFIMTLLFRLFIRSSNIGSKILQDLKYLIPALIPFWILLIPLNLVIWVNSITASEVYWRVTYMSMFWISIALYLSKYEKRINKLLPSLFVKNV